LFRIISFGYADGPTYLDNQALGNIWQKHADSNKLASLKVSLDPAITGRYASFHLDYLLATGNNNLFEAHKSVLNTPTELALTACNMALDRAGVSATDVRLILADTVTPAQVTPSEAQRLACLLGVKVPCFDIVAGDNCIAVFLNYLSNLELNPTETLDKPYYVLCFSSNTLSQFISYSDPLSSYYLGDGAGAMLLAYSAEKGFKIEKCQLNNSVFKDSPIKVSFDKHIDFNFSSAKEQICARYEYVKEQFFSFSGTEDTMVIGPNWFSTEVLELASMLKIRPELVSAAVLNNAYTFGAREMHYLAKNIGTVKNSKSVCIFTPGLNGTSGLVVLRS